MTNTSVPPMPSYGVTGRLQTTTVLSSRYQILGKLGKGGMGQVYLANDMRLTGKQWAVKEMTSATLIDVMARHEAIAAFQQEAQMLASLQHQHLPSVSDYFSENGNEYLVMEYVPGETLESLMERTAAPFPLVQALDYAEQLCDVLEYLHSHRPPIIFRDLKPGNIMVQPNGKLKLVDFGIARHFKLGQQKDTQAMGTPGYAAPEAYGKGQTDQRSDIYSLGATLHHMLTGHDPAQTPFLFTAPRQLNPSLPATTDPIIMRALAQNPQDRFQTVVDLRNNLQGLGIAPASVRGRSNAQVTVQARAANPALPVRPITGNPTRVRTTLTRSAQPNEAIVPAGATRTALAMPPAIPPTYGGAPAITAPPILAGLVYAGYARRLGAYIIDSIFSMVLYLIVGSIIGGIMYYGDFQSNLFVLGITCFIYYVWPTATSGQTLGKKMASIRVVNANGDPPGWGRAIGRYYFGFGIEGIASIFLIGILGYLWPLWDNQRQAWHDKIAGTYVVEN